MGLNPASHPTLIHNYCSLFYYRINKSAFMNSHLATLLESTVRILVLPCIVSYPLSLNFSLNLKQPSKIHVLPLTSNGLN